MEITVAITGASGAIYSHRLINLLVAEQSVSRINLVPSKAAVRVMNDELDLQPLSLKTLPEKLVEQNKQKIKLISNDDIGASIASGSYHTDSMVIIPCSMGTLGSIAHGISRDLIQRASDVMLKEKRKLILVVRDTPLNFIHLENMRLVTLAGATVFPATPSFYHRPSSLQNVVDQFLFRIMFHLGLNPDKAFSWTGDKTP